MEVQGSIIFIGDIQEVGSNGFRKRDIVIKTDEQYSQEIQIQFTGDKCDILNSYKIGEEVLIAFNLQGRSWVNKEGNTVWFNTIVGWKINRVRHNHTNDNPSPQQQPAASGYAGTGSVVDDYQSRQQTQTNPQQSNGNQEEDIDLPF